MNVNVGCSAQKGQLKRISSVSLFVGHIDIFSRMDNWIFWAKVDTKNRIRLFSPTKCKIFCPLIWWCMKEKIRYGKGERERDVIFDLMLFAARDVDLATGRIWLRCGKWPNERNANANFYRETISLWTARLMMMVIMVVMMMLSFTSQEGKNRRSFHWDNNRRQKRKEIHTDFAKKVKKKFLPPSFFAPKRMKWKLPSLYFYSADVSTRYESIYLSFLCA